jgi:hypothetical protein
MTASRDFPQIVFVRVLTAGGPYAVGNTLSVAFVNPGVGRIAAHDAPASDIEHRTIDSLVPETISARVIRAAVPYALGSALTLSFVDPTIARIHATDTPDGRQRASNANPQTMASTIVEEAPPTREPIVHNAVAELSLPIADEPIVATQPDVVEHAPAQTIADFVPHIVPKIGSYARRVEGSEPAARGGIRVRLDWNRDRVRRFVQVVDKLFAVDRLGWYRHVFAMRLLVPDVVVCGDTDTDVEALRHLHALRAASIEMLGRPLLAAFMPNFSVTPPWLDSLDKPAGVRALAGLRETLLPFATDDTLCEAELDPAWTTAAISAAELNAANASSIEALLPIFIPHASSNDDLSGKLGAYRSMLIEIFGQTTQSADAVRLNQMSQPNTALDDRLRHLARSVHETFGGLAVA